MHNTVLELGRSDCAPSISGVGHQEDDLVGLDPSHDVGYAIINPSISEKNVSTFTFEYGVCGVSAADLGLGYPCPVCDNSEYQ